MTLDELDPNRPEQGEAFARGVSHAAYKVNGPALARNMLAVCLVANQPTHACYWWGRLVGAGVGPRKERRP